MVEKTIQLDPAFLSLSGSGKKSKTKKSKPYVPSSKNKTKDLRNKFIARIKTHQLNSSKKKAPVTNLQDSNDEFMSSLEYLENKMKLKKEKTKKSKIETATISSLPVASPPHQVVTSPMVVSSPPHQVVTSPPHQVVTSPPHQVVTSPPHQVVTSPMVVSTPVVASHPHNVITSPMVVSRPVVASGTIETSNIPITIGEMPISNNMEIQSEPLYGNLKGGKKPTYRTFKNGIGYKQTNNKTMTSGGNEKNHVTIEILDKNNNEENKYAERSNKLQDLKNKAKKKTSVTKITHKLGKHKKTGKIGVLIKDRHTRRKIKEDHGKLKQKSLLEIQNFLKKQNLLKGGSNAPNDVIREMYENVMLAGDINNKCQDTLVHNYLNDNSIL